jgi:hypothetical protein
MWVFRLSWQVLLQWWVFFCLKLQGYAEGWGSTFLVNVGTDLDLIYCNNPADCHLGKWCVKNKLRFVIKCVIKLKHTPDIFDPTAIPIERDYIQPTGPTREVPSLYLYCPVCWACKCMRFTEMHYFQTYNMKTSQEYKKKKILKCSNFELIQMLWFTNYCSVWCE